MKPRVFQELDLSSDPDESSTTSSDEEAVLLNSLSARSTRRRERTRKTASGDSSTSYDCSRSDTDMSAQRNTQGQRQPTKQTNINVLHNIINLKTLSSTAACHR